MRQQVLIILKIIINKQMSAKSMRRENFLFLEEFCNFTSFPSSKISSDKETQKYFDSE